MENKGSCLQSTNSQQELESICSVYAEPWLLDSRLLKDHMQLQLLSLGFSSFQCCSGVTPASKELSCKGKKGTSEESGDSFKSYFGDQPSVFFCQTWLCLLIKGNNMRAWSACESKNLGLGTRVKWKLNNGSAHECMQQKGGNFLRNIKVMSPSDELSWKVFS